MLKPILLLWVMLCSVASSAEPRWNEYTNARFGFFLRYPPTLVPSPEPENGDGREFHTPDREFSVAAMAHFLLPENDDSLDKRWNEELESLGKTITYKRKAANWYVVSGVTEDGTEYYHKFFAKPGNWAAFHITYPHAKSSKYDPWVERIAKEFVPFLNGGIDRIEK